LLQLLKNAESNAEFKVILNKGLYYIYSVPLKMGENNDNSVLALFMNIILILILGFGCRFPCG
jgi:hypothetical protein